MKFEDPDYWKSLINMSLIRFFVLRTLHENPNHGYGILEHLKEFTDGCCTPAYGTIYPILKQLLEGGYATVMLNADSSHARKIYKLTSKGETAYQHAIKTWQEVLPIIHKIIDPHCECTHD